MESQNFIDYVRLYARAGDGGKGASHFRKEKYLSLGGPDGGDGGRGGHVGFVGEASRWTLLHLRYQRHVNAVHGTNGSRANRQGAQGKDLWVPVPLGTTIKNEEGVCLAEVLEHKEQKIVLKGGQGGRGNARFATARRRAPVYAQAGTKGESATLVLELKLFADVGLVGLPNAGKSSLVDRLSAARPTVGAYPFTTKQPVLGVVSVSAYHSFVMADLPGIIRGAAEGKGLGTRFLRHIERNRCLLFVISAEVGAQGVLSVYEQLLAELRAYNPSLCSKPRALMISKIDVCDDKAREALRMAVPAQLPLFMTSSLTGEGLQAFREKIWPLIQD